VKRAAVDPGCVKTLTVFSVRALCRI